MGETGKLFIQALNILLLLYSIIIVVLLILRESPWPIILAYWTVNTVRNGITLMQDRKKKTQRRLDYGKDNED